MRLLIIPFLFLLAPLVSLAHPGGLDSDGGHYCWTNCSYWGEVYGEWHSHSGGSTFTSSVPVYKTNADCPSYGFAYLGSCYELPDHAQKSFFSGFTCDYGYESVGYGLSEQCLKEVENGYRIGSSIFCDYGYELYYGSCLKKKQYSYTYSSFGSSAYDYNFDSLYSCPKNSSESDGKCYCDLGYELTKDKDGCKKTSKKTNDKICKADFGKGSVWSGKYDKEEEVVMCSCKKGFQFNNAGTACVKSK
jgi:hypothetical protein